MINYARHNATRAIQGNDLGVTWIRRVLEQYIELNEEEMYTSDTGELITHEYRKGPTDVKLYASGDAGSFIRNAITGTYYHANVGSRMEDFFYKVIIPGARNKLDSNTFFFESPEQYDRFFQLSSQRSSLERWQQKWNTAKQQMPDFEYETLGNVVSNARYVYA